MFDFDDLDPDRYDPDGAFDEPDHDWLKAAAPAQQRASLLVWFMTRYADPAEEMPRDEGEYIYIWGGPFHPRQVLHTEFAGVVPNEIIEDVVSDLLSQVGPDWAPRRYGDDDYDDRFDLDVAAPEQPCYNLIERNIQALGLLDSVKGKAADDELGLYVRRLVFSSLVANLESFLWETADYWVTNKESVMRACIEKIPALKDQPIKLGDLFKRHDQALATVKGFMQGIVWHRFETVRMLYDNGLGVTLPDLGQFNDAVGRRHHIVHRSGYDFEGNPVNPTFDEVTSLAEAIKKFAVDAEGLVLKAHADEPVDF